MSICFEVYYYNLCMLYFCRCALSSAALLGMLTVGVLSIGHSSRDVDTRGVFA